MNLNDLLLQKLAEWRFDNGRQTLTVAHPETGCTAAVVADCADRVGCRLWELNLTHAGAGRAADLKTRAERLAGRATGLMEPLRLIEVDAGRDTALLRSAAPRSAATTCFTTKCCSPAAAPACAATSPPPRAERGNRSRSPSRMKPSPSSPPTSRRTPDFSRHEGRNAAKGDNPPSPALLLFGSPPPLRSPTAPSHSRDGTRRNGLLQPGRARLLSRRHFRVSRAAAPHRPNACFRRSGVNEAQTSASRRRPRRRRGCR